jgi:putative DNA primase/helicase
VASLYYQIDQKQPTLLIDEADTFVHGRSELRGILNAGHSRSAAFVRRLRYNKKGPVSVEYSVWGAKAIAAIGRLPNTLMDRAIKISMRRKLPGEVVKKMEPLTLGNLKQKAARGAADNLVPLKARSVEHLEGLSDRANDNWRPLLAIADQCDEVCGREAREAALAIEPSLEAQNALELLEQPAEVRLLAGCRPAFDGHGELSADALSEALSNLPESEWKEWRNGKPITPKALSILLAKFGIFSRKGGPRKDRKLYFKADFEASWQAYLPPD